MTGIAEHQAAAAAAWVSRPSVTRIATRPAGWVPGVGPSRVTQGTK